VASYRREAKLVRMHGKDPDDEGVRKELEFIRSQVQQILNSQKPAEASKPKTSGATILD
jgi:hypothetical protein